MYQIVEESGGLAIHMTGLSPRFRAGYKAIKVLGTYPRYQAAFIFGSVAEGTSTSKSDLDVKVVIDDDNPCENINHPTFDGYKLDITFRSFKQIKEFTEDEIKKGEREPNLVRAVIVFDKTGELTELQKKVNNVKPQKYIEKDYQFVHFMLYHINDKAKRTLTDDPLASLYSMHANIEEVLKIHFKLNGRWWVSSKNVLSTLEAWDKELPQILKSFVNTADVKEKYAHWTAIIDYIARPIGGLQSIAENNCDCKACKTDLATFTRE